MPAKSETIYFSKDTLIRAFKKWNEGITANPELYKSASNDSIECATWQATHLLFLISEIIKEDE